MAYFLDRGTVVGRRNDRVVALRLADGQLREVLRFDEPGRPHSSASNGVAEHDGWNYFTLSDLQSDFWVATVVATARLLLAVAAVTPHLLLVVVAVTLVVAAVTQHPLPQAVTVVARVSLASACSVVVAQAATAAAGSLASAPTVAATAPRAIAAWAARLATRRVARVQWLLLHTQHRIAVARAQWFRKHQLQRHQPRCPAFQRQSLRR